MKIKKVTKNSFLLGFTAITVLLALVRCIFPSVAGSNYGNGKQDAPIQDDQPETISSGGKLSAHFDIANNDSISMIEANVEGRKNLSRFFGDKHPILSVSSFKKEFPDTNDLQLKAARQFGVTPVWNRREAEKRKSELVYVGSDPYFFVKDLSASIPYLVPRAAMLLHDIGRRFFDSLQVKQIPLHKITVTSVLRTKEDVARLRRRNRNATENSCHLYGTTFDVSYTRFKTIYDPHGTKKRAVQDDTLKYVLSEVLRDLRNQNRCYIKYEVKQSCFHITTR